jgi:hypothetical protein
MFDAHAGVMHSRAQDGQASTYLATVMVELVANSSTSFWPMILVATLI